MDLRSNDYYEILGVAKGADEREIKRAYFKLVRKYSPESQPEEFKRIRQAYEVLANAVSRKDYDGMTSFGDEIGARMKAGSSAMERADYKAAQAEFKHVLALQPKLAFARDLLGMAYLNAGQPREALVQFDLLVAEQPNHPVYHLHKGYAHYALHQYAQATVAYQRALEIDPADNRVRIALADVYTDTEQYEAAIVELDKAIHQDGEVNFQDFVFLMRKVQIQLLRNRPDLAEAELDEVFRILPADGEQRKYVATRIAALAAHLFRIRRSADANRLLARAKQLDKRKSLELQFPAKSTIPITELPAASQTVLASMKKNWTPSKITQRALTGPTFIAIAAGLLGLIGLWSTLGTESLWEEEGKFFMFLVIVGTPLLAALAVRRIRRVTRSPYGRFTEVTPLYLLQVDIDKVTAWPLVNLHDVALTHHLQNGSYQSTTVRMDFGGVPLALSIRGQQAAVDWAQHLLDTRHRTLALLSEGLLDSEESLDLIPGELLAGARGTSAMPASGRKRALVTYGASLAGGLALYFGGVLPLNAYNAEAGEWARANERYNPTIAGYREYLEHYPTGGHAEDARKQIAQKYDDAKRALADRSSGDGARALGQVIDAMRDAKASQIRLTFHAAGVEQTGAQTDFQAALKDGLGKVVPSEVMQLADEGGDAAASFTLNYNAAAAEPAPIAEKDRARRVRLGEPLEYQVRVDFDFATVIGGLDKYHFTRAVTRTFSCGDDLASCRSTAVNEAFNEFGEALAKDLGVDWQPRAQPRSYYNSGNAWEDQRRIDELIRQLNQQLQNNNYNFK